MTITIPLILILIPLFYFVGGLLTMAILYLTSYNASGRGFPLEERIAIMILWPVVWVTTPFIYFQKRRVDKHKRTV